MKYLEANEIVFRHIDRDGVDFDGLIEDIRAAVAEAVAAERERCCADVCPYCAGRKGYNSKPVLLPELLEWGHQPSDGQIRIPIACKAAAIRARGGGETSNTD